MALDKFDHDNLIEKIKEVDKNGQIMTFYRVLISLWIEDYSNGTDGIYSASRLTRVDNNNYIRDILHKLECAVENIRHDGYIHRLIPLKCHALHWLEDMHPYIKTIDAWNFIAKMKQF